MRKEIDFAHVPRSSPALRFCLGRRQHPCDRRLCRRRRSGAACPHGDAGDGYPSPQRWLRSVAARRRACRFDRKGCVEPVVVESVRHSRLLRRRSTLRDTPDRRSVFIRTAFQADVPGCRVATAGSNERCERIRHSSSGRWSPDQSSAVRDVGDDCSASCDFIRVYAPRGRPNRITPRKFSGSAGLPLR